MSLFPVTVATGDAFCDRDNERKLLKQYIHYGRHAVLIAPRRYGKSSLIHQTLLESRIPFTMMELTLAVSLKDVYEIIARHISQLLYTVLPKTIKARQKVLSLFKWLNPELVLSAAGQKLIFRPKMDDYFHVETISEMLKKLDEAAGFSKKRLVIVMDEFQQLASIDGHAVEAAIRHAMQYAKNITYLFSGSHRHMLVSMFNDKNRPFYHSCEIIYLNRIAYEDYAAFIQRAAKKKWEKPLPDKVLSEILSITECHCSYVNRVCGYFWLTNQFPSIKKVRVYWLHLVESKASELTETILKFSKNQRRLFIYLAKNRISQPSHSKVVQELSMSESSIRQALKKLLTEDYIYQNKEGVYCILDPALKSFIGLL